MLNYSDNDHFHLIEEYNTNTVKIGYSYIHENICYQYASYLYDFVN